MKEEFWIRNGFKIIHGSGRIRDIFVIKWTDVKSLYRKSHSIILPRVDGMRTIRIKKGRAREWNRNESLRVTFNCSSLARICSKAINQEYPEYPDLAVPTHNTHFGMGYINHAMDSMGWSEKTCIDAQTNRYTQICATRDTRAWTQKKHWSIESHEKTSGSKSYWTEMI